VQFVNQGKMVDDHVGAERIEIILQHLCECEEGRYAAG
jgi:hypothetical protein